MEENITSSQDRTRQPLRKVLRAMATMGMLSLLAALSFIFFPSDHQDIRSKRAAGLLAGHVEDHSPLNGIAITIPNVEIRRLDGLAVVTFSCEVFNTRQDLRPDARTRIEQLARSLRRLGPHIAVDIAGYAPEVEGRRAYAVGLIRASHVADCLMNGSTLRPECVALRSMGSDQLHGDADHPHSIVINISASDEAVAQLVTYPLVKM